MDQSFVLGAFNYEIDLNTTPDDETTMLKDGLSEKLSEMVISNQRDDFSIESKNEDSLNDESYYSLLTDNDEFKEIGRFSSKNELDVFLRSFEFPTIQKTNNQLANCSRCRRKGKSYDHKMRAIYRHCNFKCKQV